MSLKTPSPMFIVPSGDYGQHLLFRSAKEAAEFVRLFSSVEHVMKIEGYNEDAKYEHIEETKIQRREMETIYPYQLVVKAVDKNEPDK